MVLSPVSPAISLGFSFTGRRCIFRHSDTRSTRLLGTIDKERAGVLVGTGIGGLTMFSDGVQNLIEKGYKKITHFHSLRHNKHGFGSARY
ncbi:putative beta-ketoacyl-[acyl-carrier-protein] synthase I [Helianthus annuus]|nr:putative beta-ketoacyl-[acyl-carrier-protein] synthase I [Helianthus annuus]KAJ0882760.1 putative beta-ketoacyl-[acyl-carrier-protein] synthase I [Helianthus annuus]